jgi:FkbM family methyltransferase
MTVGGVVANARHDLHRIRQTPSTFQNWRPLLMNMAAERLRRGSAELTFRTNAGPSLACPNVPGARLAIYEQFADDCYRLAEFLAPLAGRDIVVLDVGAHIGSFATHVATLLPRARIECYEPSPQSAAYLRRNVTQNGLTNRIAVHEAAVSDTVGTAPLDDNEGGSVHNGLVRGAQRMVDGEDARDRRRVVEVATTTFDAAVATAPARPAVVKMDCEGGEYPLVYGSAPSSWASVTHLVMEYHPVQGESWSSLRSWFAAVGLHVQRDEPGRPGLGTAWLVRRGAAEGD